MCCVMQLIQTDVHTNYIFGGRVLAVQCIKDSRCKFHARMQYFDTCNKVPVY